MGAFQYKSDSRIRGKIKVDKISKDSFITWQLGLANELDPDTVNRRNIHIYDNEGKPQKISVSYDSETKKIYITQKFKCDYYSIYTLFIENVYSKNGRTLQVPLGINYTFTDDDETDDDYKGLPSLSTQFEKLGRAYDFTINPKTRPLDMLTLVLSIVSIVALFFGMFPFQAATTLGMIIWLLIVVSITVIPIVVLALCNFKRYTHNNTIAKTISICVFIVFAIINLFALAGVPINFYFLPILRI